MTNITQRNEH